jgi:hypothetical protein
MIKNEGSISLTRCLIWLRGIDLTPVFNNTGRLIKPDSDVAPVSVQFAAGAPFA